MTVRSACVSCAVAAVAVFGLATAAAAQQLPNPLQTPGAKGRAKQADVCAPDFVSKAKPVAKWQRDQALARYGRGPNDFEGDLDHLIPVSLGGTNDPDNLWPLAPAKEMGPAQKDELEAKLHELVCNNTISLKNAQDAIKKDWGKAYAEYVKGGK